MYKPLAVAAIVIPLAACQGPSAVTAVGISQDAFIAAMDASVALNASGRISDKAFVETVSPLVQDGRTIINEWRLAVKSGQRADAAALAASLQSIIAQLKSINTEASAK